jgi:hypothetical protein
MVPRDGAALRYSAADATAARNDQALAYHPFVFATPSAALPPSAFLTAGRPAALSAASDADPELRLGAVAVLASSSPLVTGATNAAIADAYACLLQEVADMSPLWRRMSPDVLQDVRAAGEFLAAVAFGFARMRVYGVVDRDGVHIQRSQLAHEPIALLPASWAGVVVTQVSSASPPVVRSVSNSR